MIPIGKARRVIDADPEKIAAGKSIVVVTYGMGVYWSLAAAKQFPGQVEVVDLRSLNPLDMDFVYDAVRRHNKVLLVTEESVEASFTLGLAGRIQRDCFESLDAPVSIAGSVDTPAIPLNTNLEAAVLPNPEKVGKAIQNLLNY